MKNSVLITAGIIAAAATGVVLLLQNRKKVEEALETAAQEVDNGKKHIRDLIQKSKNRIDHSLS